MLELIKFELKKIFSNKLIYVSAIGIAIFILGYPISRYNEVRKVFNDRSEIEALAEKYISSEYTMEDIKDLRKAASDKLADKEEISKDDEFLLKYFGSIIKVNKDLREENLKVVEDKLIQLENKNEEDSFYYKSVLKEKEMLGSLKKQESFYLGDWGMVFDFNVAATMKLILLVLGLASIFSGEYSSKVSYLNLSTKNGKTKLNTAKITAALIYGTIVFIFISIIYHLCGTALGIENGHKSASFLYSSLYNMSINKYYIITLAFSYLGTIIFSLLIVLLSLLSKNILVSFGLPLAIYFIPDMLRLPEAIMKYTYNLNFTQLLKGKNIFGEFITFNVFGEVVIYPYVMLSLGIISLIIMLLIYNKISKKQVIV